MKRTIYIAVLLLLIGAVSVYFGIRRGEVQTVFQKSTNICLECVGIG